MRQFRLKHLTTPVFNLLKKQLPPLSQTEREAMEAGSVWWEGALFSGSPRWQTLLDYPKPSLTPEEQAFIDGQVETLLSMIDDDDIVQHRKDLPDEVWDYLKREKFFSLIIPKQYGGLAFSAYANSTIVSKIATRSLSVAVSVMVPNSLGPGELLTHYGTEDQKSYWLPRLADGREIPCFALTGPEAGSDAGGIPDKGVVTYGDYQGEKVLGISLTWNKRYITLAPVASVLGLAFKLYDPDGLLGDSEEIGITCAMIPTDHPGVEIGERHNPLNMAFMNGPTRGEDVFIPLDWLIGGQDYAGKGWRMLVECLSAGRGISLPALGAAIGHLATRTTGAFAMVRKQFGTEIGQFEGVAEAVGRIGGLTYLLEAARGLTTTALDMGEKPGIVTAIAKYHMTELARVILNDAMDVHAGKAIQLGPNNYIGLHYFGMPVAITVEGANILTRNLMIFGQGATRCHPYILQEMEVASERDNGQALYRFDELLMKHIRYSAGNALKAFGHAVTGSRFASSPVSGETAGYYRHLGRMSKALAVATDFSMLSLGGDLKRREMISARLGDVLSHLYLASAVLKRYEEQGRRQEDLIFVHYGAQYCLARCAGAFEDFLANFPQRSVAWGMRALLFPLGNHFRAPSDDLLKQIAKAVATPGQQRDKLTHLCVEQRKESALGQLDAAFVATYQTAPILKRITKAVKAGDLTAKLPMAEQIAQAVSAGIISQEEKTQIESAEALRREVINVDQFTSEQMNCHNPVSRVA
ncbi:acyl-CoA dehydrogenase [Thaumasiovibrio subtropicus]|uniref:acyl-CoA dehydrogenase n=1 Tax=Thaumasiovibrio subtropicus TaxID=1891207 RepID=UPI000B356751|nr:acyl-CoA dehydrogenase [Thaumasiovibrio subtropicus]